MTDMQKGFIMGYILGSVVFITLVSWGIDVHWEKQAIEHGAAHYDKVTGNWEWNK